MEIENKENTQESTKEINEFVVKQQLKINILLPVCAFICLLGAFLLKEENSFNKYFYLVNGSIFLVLSFVYLLRRKKLIKNNTQYFEENPSKFEFFKQLNRATNMYIKIRWIFSVILIIGCIVLLVFFIK